MSVGQMFFDKNTWQHVSLSKNSMAQLYKRSILWIDSLSNKLERFCLQGLADFINISLLIHPTMDKHSRSLF